ncbi:MULTISPECIES: hypothetical protein [Pseudoalteromonas]|uniref:hypothetical protein n=1 Tax=Pseudoalteromonas TaxID=53246 RepID=UPI0002AAA8A1|nr:MULTISPECIES: hypothetical protein [unclassified Pseudoalteromonas]ALQ09867.1 hypothetical protein D172_017350 [Pseudoalteromonas sp. Bsw20308]KDC50508.1 hypothetical protein DO88_17510 [Pseudoalteromonas sp. S3431]
MELCKYCKKNEAIENSHIIPSFIFKWLKKTSPTGFIRATNEPNKREQDGPKSPLLCNDCEVEFSEVENCFKKETFSKLANYREPCPQKLDISESSRKCIYVIAWRVLADTYYFPKDNQYTECEFNRFPEFLDDIKRLIEGDKSKKFRTHLIPCTREVLTKLDLPKVDWFYYERSVGAEPRIWDNWERFLVYIKVPFAIICFEIVPNNKDVWCGTKIDEVDCINLSEITDCPDYVSGQIEHFFGAFLKSKELVTGKQLEKMSSDMKKANPDCGSFQSMNKKW